MNLARYSNLKGRVFLIATLLSSSVGYVVAGTLSLETAPLFTTSNIKPNLIMAIDDSGSMDFETLFVANDGALWWNTSTESFIGYDSAGQPNFNTSGSQNSTWKKNVYLFPNGTGTGNRQYADGSMYAIPPFPQYAYTRSSEYNESYYDPNVTYGTWADYGSTSYDDIDPENAPSDPYSGGYTFDLTSNITSSSSNFLFRFYSGMVIPSGSYIKESWDSAWKTTSSAATATFERSAGVRYYPATYYTVVSSGSFSTGSNSYDCDSPTTDSYLEFHAAPSSFSSSDGVDAIGPDGQCLEKVEIKSSTSSYANDGGRTDCAGVTSCTYTEEMQNFANWFSYFRKRHLALRNGMGNAFSNMGGIRTGLFTINNRNDVTMLDFDTESDDFFSSLYAIDGNSAGTPNREALQHAGNQFMRTDSDAPVIASCQKNFTLFFTDGYANVSNLSGIDNEDGSAGEPYEDSYSDTMGDVAYKYYNTVLRTGSDYTAGEVPTATGCNASTVDPSLDCNDDLHMNTFVVGLGAQGTIFDVTHFDVADAYTTTPTWPDVSSTRDKKQIDDLYHAAVNGRGEIFNAQTPEELQSKLSQALTGIQSSIGTAASVAFNTSTLESNSAVYLAYFNSANWTGELIAYALDSVTGAIDSTAAWSAADVLDDGGQTYDSRTILSYNGTTGIPFRFSSLSSSQQSALNTASGNVGERIVNYIRGDQTYEGVSGYRQRTSLLGDIVHSDPVYVGVPSLSWPSTSPFPTTAGERYFEFKYDQQVSPRTTMVYTGANDGMLHGFIATTDETDSGKEVIAYVPSELITSSSATGLTYLTDRSYEHNYYVDLAPTISDAYIKTATSGTGSSARWRTILIGGMRSGGRGLFALDVTDPSTFTESNADDLVLWEFTHSELGYTYSEPIVAMMENGEWAMIFGNGYNDNGNGQAKLFIVFLEGGLDGAWTDGSGSSDLDYIILDTGVGSTTTPNGLASPAVVDEDGDGAADRVFAGDLEGNLWAFDLSATNEGNWAVAYKQGSTPKPLFTATDDDGAVQPITSKPIVVRHPDPPSGNHDPDLLVFFGTGKYLETSDVTNTDVQSFYGVWDEGTKALSRTNLVEQTFLFDEEYTDSDGKELRILTDNTVDYDNYYGWYIDLPESGERVVVNPQVRNSLVYFNTWIPATSECSFGGSGFLMSVKQENGGRPDNAAFDISGDGAVSDSDEVTNSGISYAPAGQEFVYGLPAASSFLSNIQYTPGTGSNVVDTRVVEDSDGLKTGRLSWEELRKD